MSDQGSLSLFGVDMAPGPDRSVVALVVRAEPGGVAGRDRALATLEEHRPRVVEALRREAVRVFAERQEPISVNDIRHVLAREGYEGDPRILGATFHHARWLAVGWTTVQGSAANARPVRTFVPRVRGEG